MASVAVLPPLDFAYFRSPDLPSEGTIKRLGLELKQKLFTNGKHYYRIEDVAALLDIVSGQR